LIKNKTVLLILLTFSLSLYSKTDKILENLDQTLRQNLIASDLKKVKKQILKQGNKAVPLLINVMKAGKYPIKNRWAATFLLGQIMGKKSAPFIARFAEHPHWTMRVASLKTLLALKQKKYSDLYTKALDDKSLLVRIQALENIRHLKLKSAASNVWAMIFEEKNYQGTQGKLKRSNIIKNAIRTVGELDYQMAKKALLRLSQKKQYEDIFGDIEYSLSKLLKKKLPKGSVQKKRKFLKKFLS